ncbi:MAG TPA: hypothetical protein G4N96_05450 [Chloroflexi bacterium]|nr:hypothetical protein [Chloroflexota bacterium]
MTHPDDLQQLISDHNRRLQRLKQQEVLYDISADPRIPIEIEDLEAQLETLQAQLAAGGKEPGAPPTPPFPQQGGVTIHAGKGSVINASTGGDIVAGSGNRIINTGGGDYTEGDKTTVGDVSNSAAAIGKGAQAALNQGVSGEALADFFASIARQISDDPKLRPADKADAKAELAEIEEAAAEDPEALKDSFLSRRLRNIERAAPDIIDVILATLANPVAGLGVVGAKIKAKAEEVRQARTKGFSD